MVHDLLADLNGVVHVAARWLPIEQQTFEHGGQPHHGTRHLVHDGKGLFLEEFAQVGNDVSEACSGLLWVDLGLL